MSESRSVFEQQLDEYAQFEQEADQLLAEVDPDGTDRGYAVTRRLRDALKRQGRRFEQAVADAKQQARQELVVERQRESAFRRLAVPQTARALFEGVDVTDFDAMAARAEELREAGLSWPGQPQPPGPLAPDPGLAAVAAMQAASAGGITSESYGDLKTRMLDMERNPGAYTDQQRQAAVDEFNRQVRVSERGGAGALG